MNAAQKLIREHNLTWEEFAELIKMADDPQVDALLAEEMCIRDRESFSRLHPLCYITLLHCISV